MPFFLAVAGKVHPSCTEMEPAQEERPPDSPTRFYHTLWFWALVLFGPFAATWLAMTFIYASTPCYIDHVESTITVAAQQWLHGRPLYHSAEGPYLYILLLGPLDYLTVALALTLCPDPILASKLAGGCWSLATMALLFFVYRRESNIRWAIVGLGIVGCEAMLDMLTPFWDRPDPILFFSTALGLAALQVRNGRFAAVLLVLAIAMATDAKIHSVLYLLPCLALWFRRHGFLSTGLIAFAGVILAGVPFLLPGVSLVNYITWLRLGLQQPRSSELLWDNVQTLVQILLPLLFFIEHPRLRWKWPPPTEESLMLVVVAISGALVCLPASKVGAGWHHLLPFAVYIGYLACRMLPDLPVRAKYHWAVIVVGIWLCFAGQKVVSNCSYVIWYFQNMPYAQIQADLRQVLRTYPAKETQMGVGRGNGYITTFYSPWIYREGTPCVINIGAYMDMKEAGLNAEALRKSLETEEFRYWIIPRDGPPFSMDNWYDNEPLFDDSIRDAFAKHYAPVSTSAFYVICQAKGLLLKP